MRPVMFTVLFALGSIASFADQASAQCATCPAPAQPVVTTAYSPVVLQTTTVRDGWYPGKWLANTSRRIFGYPRATTTYTAGYAPVATTPYTVGYAPAAPYTVGYAPAARTYTVGFTPTTNAGIIRTAYRPTYPATYGPVTMTVARPVALAPVTYAVSAPVVPACSTCSACTSCDPCNACSGGVVQSSFSSPVVSSGCSSCQASAGTTYAAPSGGSTVYSDNPAPSLAPNENPAADRSLLETNKPETSDDLIEDTIEDSSDSASTGEYFNTAPLFAPNNRVTRNTHPSPVRTAVYRPSTDSVTPASHAAGRRTRVDASGWSSASR